ncbi:hypothetical protein P3T76_006046 [Phytophthora citrophthora]|uniref:RxLR effector protein n=1 Tax=Phytophthora citrophthora TaxID=4793 RepID=A0AAD9LPB5_9STRA|nr:hypothetical protein P3T76_006046 [Phytophthora citrophthora]
MSAKRTLRSNEERTFSTGVTESLSNWMSRAAPKLLLTDNELEHLAMQVASTDKVFKMLKLDDGLDGLLRNPNLKAFATYIRMVDETNSDQVLITTLINRYGDEALAKFLFEAKQVKTTEEIAKKLQAAQFVKWFDEGKTTNQVFDLLQLTHLTAYEDKFHKIWWEYVVARAELASKLKKPLPVEL